MASFSKTVKYQIIDEIKSRNKEKAVLFGMLSLCKELSSDKLKFTTENEETADFLYHKLKSCCNVSEINLSETKKRGRSTYNVSVSGKSEIDKIKSFTGGIGRYNLKDLKGNDCASVIAGVFLAVGSVTDPNKEYHMEFVLPSVELCNDLGLLFIESFGIIAKHVSRKNSEIVYLKESENIEDMLTLMGASKSTLEMINVKILKNVRNKVNRVMNCENANIERTVRASEKQIEDIELIEKTVGLDILPDDIYETARLRYENPELTLKELGELFKPAISKSGVNHRLEKIKAVADNIRKNGGTNK